MMKVKDETGVIIPGIIKQNTGVLLPQDRKEYIKFQEDRALKTKIINLEKRIDDLQMTVNQLVELIKKIEFDNRTQICRQT